jgi:hypothetical protein
MKLQTQQATALLSQLEGYLGRVAKTLPSPKTTDLLKYLALILGDISPRSRLLRQAFGLPGDVSRSRSLLKLLKWNEPSLQSIVSLHAQRIHQFLWRADYTLQNVDVSWKDEALSKFESVSELCEPYLVTERPTLPDLALALDLKKELKWFSESAADPTLFAVLRAYDYPEAQLPLTDAQLQSLKDKALTFVHDYLTDVVERRRSVDDSSNIWWALRLGLESGDARFGTLVKNLVDAFPKPITPSSKVKSLSVVPEIYTELRTCAYTVSSIEAMLAIGDSGPDSRSQLQAIMSNAAQKLLHAPSENLYLASVHSEGLRKYLDHTEHEYIASKMHGRRLALSDFRPVGEFVCVDAALESDIGGVVSWLKSVAVQKSRTSVLVYGSSSTGKSFLVEQLFTEFGQKDFYKDRHIVCSPSVDVPTVLQRTLAAIAASPPGGPPAFLFLDEVDVEFSASIYPNLLTLLDKGEIRGSSAGVDELVLFWAGGKHGSVQGFKTFLEKKQASKQFEKGIDMFNRSKRRLNLPSSLIRNKNQKLVLGLAAIAKQFRSPVKVDWGTVEYLRNMPMSDKQGVREFEALAGRLKCEAGVVFLPDEKRRGNEIEVIA